MATYAIGDVQGCYNELMALLEKIAYDPNKDQLWFTGDLVNRGPHSLKTLRFIYSLPVQPIVVLGNHDLHLLAVAYGAISINAKDTSNEILNAPDRDDLLTWLRQRPLIYQDTRLGYAMVHAGIYPGWTLKEAMLYANELEAILKSDQYTEFFQHMYGNEPSHWDATLTGWERLRFIANAFTRMRFCTPDGGLNLTIKETAQPPQGLVPWFEMPMPNQNLRIIFGHWAALGGAIIKPGFFHLDTGCVWGGKLTAIRLEDGELIQVPGQKYVA